MSSHVARGPEQLAQVARLVGMLSPDKPWRITIAQYRSNRTIEQNSRMHALLRAVSAETGNDLETLKDWSKSEFGFLIEVKLPDGRVAFVPKPTSKYTTEEASIFMERFEAWAATELGIMV